MGRPDVSEAVAPGFRYDDHEMATVDAITAEDPSLVGRLRPYILDGTRVRW